MTRPESRSGPLAGVDFDFQRYIERRRGAREAEAREGAVYAYVWDQRVRRAIGLLRPVTLLLSATARMWRLSARAEVLGPARRVTDGTAPRVAKAAALASERLHVALPPLFVSPGLSAAAGTFGSDDEPQLVLHAALERELDEAGLVFVLGSELSRVQNRHVLLHTACAWLDRAVAGSLQARATGPARAALSAWRRRGQITVDRGGLIATRDLDAATRAIEALARFERADGEDGGPGIDEAVAGDRAEGAGLPGDAARATRLRCEALAIFAKGAYYRGLVGESGGKSAREVDAEVSARLGGKAGDAARGGDDPRRDDDDEGDES